MPVFDENTTKQLSGILTGMINPVHLVFFKGEGPKSIETENFLTEFTAFSGKLTLETIPFVENSPEAREWHTAAAPAVWVTTADKSLRGVGFYGTPGGFEINSFLMSILEVSGKKEALSPDFKKAVDAVSTETEIRVYVALTCSQCPTVVINAHRLAIENPKIRTVMIEGPAFKDECDKNGIKAFPHLVIGDKKAEVIGENGKDMAKIISALSSL